MMGLNKKLSRCLPWLTAIGLYLTTRLYHLLTVPIFTDEAIYVRWAQIASTDATQRFISLTDGKQPSLIWAGAILMRVIDDPLLAVRLVSVIAGLMTTVGIYLLSLELFRNKNIAFVASILYVIFPFALVYDKLAVYDSLVAALAVWSLYLEVLLVHYRRLDVALMTSAVIGLGLLTKSSALFFIYLLPFSVLLFDIRAKNIPRRFAAWVGLCILAVAGALVISSILQLSPHYPLISAKNDLFVYPLSEWVRSPFVSVAHNARYLISWLCGYVTIPILLLVGLAIFIQRSVWREKLLLLVWFLVPFTALAFFAKPTFLFPRYIFFMTIPLLVLAASALVKLTEHVSSRRFRLFFLLIPILLLLRADFYILTDFAKAPLPASDKNQLIAGYPSGVGVREAVTFIEEKSANQKIYVATEGTFGLMPQALQIYLDGNPNVEIVGYWPIARTIPEQVLVAAQVSPAYFIFYAPCELCSREGIAPSGWPLRPVFQIPRIGENSYFTLYEVIP